MERVLLLEATVPYVETMIQKHMSDEELKQFNTANTAHTHCDPLNRFAPTVHFSMACIARSTVGE